MNGRPHSLTGRLSRFGVLARPGPRRAILGVLFVIAVLFALFPERHRAAVTLTPTDPASLGLSGTLGQLGAVQSVFGNQAAVEVSLRIARSDYVRDRVNAELGLGSYLGKNRIETLRWLDRKVDIHALRGGIIEFEVTLGDALQARKIVDVYARAVREQLASISRTQTAYKRDILVDLVEQANRRLTRAQAAYDTFRLRTRYSSPQAAIMAVGDRVPKLEDAIKSKRIQLAAARQFFTDDNMNVRQIHAEIAALEQQLAQTRSVAPGDDSSVGRVVRESTEVDRLRRDLDLALGLYDNYKRYLQGTSVEDLTSTANVRILEPAYVDSQRQYNWPFVILAGLVLLLAAVIEFYQMRPPLEPEATT
jgi:capsule polysaccharide export protein KpsE/RkpR